MILWTCKETSGSLQLDVVRDLLEMKKQTFTPSLCIARARRCMKFLSFAPESEVLPPCRERDDGPWEAVHLAASWLCCCWPSGCSYSQEKRLVYCAWGGHFATSKGRNEKYLSVELIVKMAAVTCKSEQNTHLPHTCTYSILLTDWLCH